MAVKAGRPRKTEGEREYSIRALDRAVAVLDVFSVERPELSLAEIARESGLSKPTAFRILHTLEKNRFVVYDEMLLKYRLGPKLLKLGGIAISTMTLRRTARNHLNALSEATGATVLMGVLLDDKLVYVDKRVGTGPIRIASEIGWHRECHFGMLGMILLAFSAPGKTAALLDEYPLRAHTRHSITDRKLFDSRLQDIRMKGYCLEFDEAFEGIWGVAAPIFDYTNKIVAAVGASLTSADAVGNKVEETVHAATACAYDISLALGCTAPSVHTNRSVGKGALA